jgi:predicted acylesterase/phospholipase RssA
MQWRNPRVHLVLGSGGVRCLSYVGAFEALAERNIEVASVSTCSAGTLMGALLCTPGLSLAELKGRLIEADLEAMAGRPRWPRCLGGLGRLLSLWKWPFSAYQASGIGDAYERIAGSAFTLGDLAYQDKPVEFITATVDMDHDRILVYSRSTHKDMKVNKVIDIAVAAPTLYPPVETNGRTLIDAVVFSEIPIWLAAGLTEPLPIIALRPKNELRRAEDAAHVVEFILDAFTSAVRSRDHYFVGQIPNVHLVEIESSERSYYDFRLSTAKKEALFLQGYGATTAVLNRLEGNWWQTPPIPLQFNYSNDEHQRAQDRAAELITRFQRKLGRHARTGAFISYSHDDAPWLDRLKQHFERHALQDVFWDDEKIQAGEQWENRIREGLARAKVVVMLVSKEFLDSAYVREEELPEIVRLAAREGVRLLWLPLDEAGYHQGFLRPFEALSKRPLKTLTEDDAGDQLEHAANQIVAAVRGEPTDAL